MDIKAAVVIRNHGNQQHSRNEDSDNEIQPVREPGVACRPTSRKRLPAVMAAESRSVPQQNLKASSTNANRTESNSKDTVSQQQAKPPALEKYMKTRPRSQALARMRSAPKSISKLKKLLSKQRPWYAQPVVHVITLLMMMMLCILR
jgi:hypothetical protein